jgi:hypothetical protein
MTAQVFHENPRVSMPFSASSIVTNPNFPQPGVPSENELRHRI